MAEKVADVGAEDIDCVIPLPLSPQRYTQRGFNQAEELAHFAARKLALPVDTGLLQRKFHQLPQAQLGRRQRLSNIKGAFSSMACPANTRIALVDDVMTTGATAFEAAETLLAAGAASVDLWVFARTP